MDDWITWSSFDNNVFILKPYDPNFSDKVLKKYFKHGNISSFVRQLHMYGFHKIATVHNNNNVVNDKVQTIWHFKHPSGNFTRDVHLDSLKKIQRKSTGIGKDGKRKNMLSTLSVSYLKPVLSDRASAQTIRQDDMTGKLYKSESLPQLNNLYTAQALLRSDSQPELQRFDTPININQPRPTSSLSKLLNHEPVPIPVSLKSIPSLSVPTPQRQLPFPNQQQPHPRTFSEPIVRNSPQQRTTGDSSSPFELFHENQGKRNALSSPNILSHVPVPQDNQVDDSLWKKTIEMENNLEVLMNSIFLITNILQNLTLTPDTPSETMIEIKDNLERLSLIQRSLIKMTSPEDELNDNDEKNNNNTNTNTTNTNNTNTNNND